MHKDIFFLSFLFGETEFFRYLLDNFRSPKALTAALISAIVVIVSSYIVERLKKHKRKNDTEAGRGSNSYGTKAVFIKLLWFVALCVVILVSDGAIEYITGTDDNHPREEDTAEETSLPSPSGEMDPFLSIGEIVEFGTFKQTKGENGTWKNDPIRWIVIAIEDEKALLLSEKGLTYKPISSVIVKDDTLAWTESPLQSWLASEFCGISEDNVDRAFSDEERSVILKNSDGSYAVGLLTKTEAETMLSGPDARVCKPTDYAGYVCENNPESKQGMSPTPCYSGDYWWLCDPGNDYCSYMTVDKSGAIKTSGTRYTYCGIMVRPTVWISIREYSRLFG